MAAFDQRIGEPGPPRVGMDVEAVQLTVGSFIERDTDVTEADHSSGDEAAEHLIVRVPPVGPMVVDQFATPTIERADSKRGSSRNQRGTTCA